MIKSERVVMQLLILVPTKVILKTKTKCKFNFHLPFTSLFQSCNFFLLLIFRKILHSTNPAKDTILIHNES